MFATLWTAVEMSLLSDWDMTRLMDRIDPSESLNTPDHDFCQHGSILRDDASGVSTLPQYNQTLPLAMKLHESLVAVYHSSPKPAWTR